MDRRIGRQPYAAGFRNVADNLLHPWQNIRKYGTSDFFHNEILNFNFNPDRMQFLPNYSLHLIGNAMQYVKLAEWYACHDYPLPHTLSLLTTLSYQLLNEALENGSYRGANVDPIADMLIFNPLGLLLFSTNWAKRFFSTTFPIFDWSGQPFLCPFDGRMENAGQQYAAKAAVAASGRYSLFFYWGVQTVVGVSIARANGAAFSCGFGSVAYDLRYGTNNQGRIVTAVTKPILGFFYDRE
ncbi:MAG: hypothetical protein ONB12_04395, partial [candidate division KSB1 bacterium]|nr:hypothetical protein [candidate division KSB1 bacterium]